jgi:hypothetical protein
MLTTYLSNALANNVVRGSNYTPPTTIYVALFTADPTVAGTQTNEVADSAYSRVDAAGGDSVDTGWSAPSGGISANAKLIQFPAIADGQVAVTHVALMDAATDGNMLDFDQLRDINGDPAPRTLEIADVMRFEIGQLKYTAK